jgi:hypothetical protein
VYATQAATVVGVTPASTVWLRGYGDVPVASAVADASGVATFSGNHWPHYSVEIDGTDYPVSGGAWGGDVYNFATASIGAAVPPWPARRHRSKSLLRR